MPLGHQRQRAGAIFACGLDIKLLEGIGTIYDDFSCNIVIEAK